METETRLLISVRSNMLMPNNLARKINQPVSSRIGKLQQSTPPSRHKQTPKGIVLYYGQKLQISNQTKLIINYTSG